MSQNKPQNRLHLNFGLNDRNFAAEQGRAFPTTPSSFPQPVYPNAAGQREVWGAQPTTTGTNAAGYFANNPYHVPYQQANNMQSTGPYRAAQYDSATNGLVHQFSHQNLGGGTPRSSSPYTRQPSPGQRPRTAGSSAPQQQQQQQHGQQQYGNFLQPGQAPSPAPFSEDEEPPVKNPDQFTDNVMKRAKVSTEQVGAFFRENVGRARERNKRQQKLEQILNDPSISTEEKQRKINQTARTESEFLRFLRTQEKPSNYRNVKIIGKGAFGEVKLVERKKDGNIFALKQLVKSEMFKKDQLAHVRSERDILAESESEWVVRLHTTFQDPTFLYMLMEYLPGGDLMTMLIKYEIFTEDITRFYMAEICLAIEAVHKLGFIHRDIKPDNILLDKGGHIKLTDFGLSTGFHKEHEASYYQQLLSHSRKTTRDNRNSVSLDQIQLTVSNRNQINTWRKSRRQLAYSTVGTPDYIAPEIFSGKGYDFGCDWWSLGTIMFECLIGWPPFCAEDASETYRKIVDWQRNLHFPPEQQLNHISENFIRSLITDPDTRLGRLGGAHEIKSHPYFAGVDFASLRGIRAPFEPKLQSRVDVSNFPIEEIDQSDHSAALRAQTLQHGDEYQAEMSLPFIGYTYKRFDAFRGS
ncbi:MAG: hypothetical protein Q9165_008309 [Trypethelium subeluteriae]